jgi:hypothetical protein
MILKLTKKKKQQRGIVHSTVGDSAGSLSTDLAVGTEENQKMLLAIKSFIDIVHNHIQALLNTAIHIQHENAKTKRFFLGRTKRGSGSKAFPPIFEEDGIATGKPPKEPSKHLIPKTPDHVPAGIASLSISESVINGGEQRHSSANNLVESSATHASSSTAEALSSVMGNKATLTTAVIKAKSLNESSLITSKKTAATADVIKLSGVDDLRSTQMKSRHSYPQNKQPEEQPVNSHAGSRPSPRNSLTMQQSGIGSNQGTDKLLKAPQSNNTKQSGSGKATTNAVRPRSPRSNKATSSADAVHSSTEGTVIINQTPPYAIEEHQSEKSSNSEKLETASVCSTASSLPALRVVSALL